MLLVRFRYFFSLYILYFLLLQNLSSSIFSNTQSSQAPPVVQETRSFTPPPNPPLPVQAPVQTAVDNSGYSYSTNSYASSHSQPLQPPPMPPFSKNDIDYTNSSSFDMIFTSNTASAQFGELLFRLFSALCTLDIATNGYYI